MNHGTPIALAALATGPGYLVGAAGRLVLRRLPRGVAARARWCEVSAAALAAAAVYRAATAAVPWWWLPVPLLLGCFGVPLAVTDLRARRLPDSLTLAAYPAIAVAVAVAGECSQDGGLAARALLGAVLFCGAHLVARLLAPSGIGAGDVKLAGSLGAVLGAVGLAALALAAALAALITALLWVVARGRWSYGIPHGPGMLAATWLIAIFPGSSLVAAA